MNRNFIINTPIGKLRVYAKHEVDCAADYPGVFIDLVDNDDDPGEMLCCVEYDSVSKNLQTVVYQPGNDDPEAVIVHERMEKE